MNKQDKRLLGMLLTVGCLLLAIAVANRFSEAVNWSLFDFIIAGILLVGTSLLCEWVMRKVKDSKQRILFCAAILIGFCLTWIELAVGIFGSPFAGN